MKELSKLRRNMGGHVFCYDMRYGAYGQRRKALQAARERAASLRAEGKLARVTLEHQDYGLYAVVWVASSSAHNRRR